MSPSTDIRYTIRERNVRVPFRNIAQLILGKAYALSLVLCADTLATRLNRTYRNKTYTPNILAFPLSPSEGEIFLNVRRAEREARSRDVPRNAHISFLFIHACLHLKGLKHGKKMEVLERAYLQKINLVSSRS